MPSEGLLPPIVPVAWLYPAYRLYCAAKCQSTRSSDRRRQALESAAGGTQQSSTARDRFLAMTPDAASSAALSNQGKDTIALLIGSEQGAASRSSGTPLLAPISSPACQPSLRAQAHRRSSPPWHGRPAVHGVPVCAHGHLLAQMDNVATIHASQPLFPPPCGSVDHDSRCRTRGTTILSQVVKWFTGDLRARAVSTSRLGPPGDSGAPAHTGVA